MMTTRHKIRRGAAESGQAIVLVALGMIGLLAFMVLAIDGGRFYQQRRRAQNAADMSALGGLYMYTKATDPSTTVNEHNMLIQINTMAEKNEIADTDGTVYNAVNGNVTAWWVDKNGQKLPIGAPAQMQDSTSRYAPSGMNGIQVEARIPYNTFVGGLIGQSALTALADSTARIHIRYEKFTDDNNSIFTIGGDCNNLTDAIAHNYIDTNTSKFLAGVYVGGSLTVGNPPGGGVNASDFYGDFQVAAKTGLKNSATGLYDDIGTTDPFTGGGNDFHSHNYIPPSSTPKGYPKWTQVYKHTTGAPDFFDGVHNTPEGAWHQNLSLFQAADDKLVYAYVAGDPGAEAAVQAVVDANSGKHLVIFVDGDITTNDNSDWPDTTLIINGKFDNNVTGRDFYSAGPIVGNISILAGADPGGKNRCASDSSKWVFHAQGNNTQFHGIVYVPYGQIFFDGNTSGGQDFSDAVITYSVYLNGNSWQFNFDPNKLVWPVPSTELNK